MRLTSMLPLTCNLLIAVLSPLFSFAQTAPAHLKYFGMAVVDCYWDDPNDSSATVNYLSEVDSFSNLAQLCVFDYQDNIVARTQDMNSHCVLPLLSIQSVFFNYVDAQAPSGANYDLFPDFVARWNTFKIINAAVLDSAQVGCFYLADEPLWNGMTFADMDTVCKLVKADFPNIPTSYVEAWPVVDSMQVPTSLDWIGFDRYAIFDPENDPGYRANYDTVKARRSAPHQKIVLIVDDQWHPYHGALGLSPDTVAAMAQNYFDLAVNDTDVIGLIGYIWPGGLDGAGHLGLRNLNADAIQANVDMGLAIKANFNPCGPVVATDEQELLDWVVYPNPAGDQAWIRFDEALQVDAQLRIWNHLGTLVQSSSLEAGCQQTHIELKNLPSGTYWVRMEWSQPGKTVVLVKQ